MHGYLYYSFAFLFVMGLIGLFGLGLNLINQRGLMPGLLDRLSGIRSQRRLAIQEQLAIDPQHRLVLVRADQSEFLLLIGREHNLLVHSKAARPERQDNPRAPAGTTAQSHEAIGGKDSHDAAANLQSATPMLRTRNS